MFVLDTIYKFIKGTLASFGLFVISFLAICLFTNLPVETFNKLRVEPVINKADTIVVLGAGVTQGGWPGKASLERTVKGVILYKKGLANKIIFSGGWDHDGYIASAKAMAAVAKDLGVPPNAIIIEDQSHNTFENAKFTKDLMEKNQMKSALLVTSDSHMRRSAMVFTKLNIPIFPVPVEQSLAKPELNWRSKIVNLNALYQTLYEAAGIIKYKIKGWV